MRRASDADRRWLVGRFNETQGCTPDVRANVIVDFIERLAEPEPTFGPVLEALFAARSELLATREALGLGPSLTSTSEAARTLVRERDAVRAEAMHFELLREVLGAVPGEVAFDAARRVVRERDDANARADAAARHRDVLLNERTTQFAVWRELEDHQRAQVIGSLKSELAWASELDDVPASRETARAMTAAIEVLESIR
jgi:hypothetical protein